MKNIEETEKQKSKARKEREEGQGRQGLFRKSKAQKQLGEKGLFF